MLIIAHYTIVYNEAQKVYRIHNKEPPLCPNCGVLLSGYDTRHRYSIDGAGKQRDFILRRLRCPSCKKLHLELPDFMQPQKHYAAHIIEAVLDGHDEDCPAEVSTMWRWRNENYPPALQCLSGEGGVKSTYSDAEEDKS